MDTPNATIIIVDDEPALLRLMKLYLERLGYRVVAHEDAGSALQTFEAAPDAFSLLVADLTLPDMSGDQMALRMAEVNSALKVLLCSGYPFDVTTLPPQMQSRFATLQKPFLPNMLAEVVKKLLDGK